MMFFIGCYLQSQNDYLYPWEWSHNELSKSLAFLSQELRQSLYKLVNQNLLAHISENFIEVFRIYTIANLFEKLSPIQIPLIPRTIKRELSAFT